MRHVGDIVALVTRERDAGEIEAIIAMCRPPNGAQVSGDVLGELGTNEAALLPGAGLNTCGAKFQTYRGNASRSASAGDIPARRS